MAADFSTLVAVLPWAEFCANGGIERYTVRSLVGELFRLARYLLLAFCFWDSLLPELNCLRLFSPSSVHVGRDQDDARAYI